MREVILDLGPLVADSGRMYRPSVVAATAPDGHWNAWIEFVDSDSGEVLRTGIETRQTTEADLHHWASVLSDVYLQGAVCRATQSGGLVMTATDTERPPVEDPLAELERHLITAFLAGAGEDFQDLLTRHDARARKLLAEASRYASDKLAEVEARSHYLRELHGKP